MITKINRKKKKKYKFPLKKTKRMLLPRYFMIFSYNKNRSFVKLGFKKWNVLKAL